MGVPTRSSLPSWAHKGAPSVWKIQSSHTLNHSVLPYGKRLLAPELQSYSYHVTLTGSDFFFGIGVIKIFFATATAWNSEPPDGAMEVVMEFLSLLDSVLLVGLNNALYRAIQVIWCYMGVWGISRLDRK